MWLPKNERKALGFYARWAVRRDGFYTYSSIEQTELINELSKVGKGQQNHQRNSITTQEIKQINVNLENLGLIKRYYIGQQAVKITPEGLRLGQKYNCWWTRSKLWYDEYIKDHWIWLFICFIVGGVIIQLINWLWAYSLKTPGTK